MTTPTVPAASYDEVMISLGLEPSTRPRREAAECGTYSGYNSHLARGERGDQIDPACREANRVYKAKRFRAHKNARTLPPIKHGTPQGAQQHWYRRESACELCLAARRTVLSGGGAR